MLNAAIPSLGSDSLPSKVQHLVVVLEKAATGLNFETISTDVKARGWTASDPVRNQPCIFACGESRRQPAEGSEVPQCFDNHAII